MKRPSQGFPQSTLDAEVQDFFVQYDSIPIYVASFSSCAFGYEDTGTSRNVLIAVTDVPKPAGSKGANLQGVLPGEGKAHCAVLVAIVFPAVPDGLS